MEQQNKSRGPLFSRYALRGILCAYALYMGYIFLKEYFQGTATVQPGLSWLFGLGFIAFGLVYGILTLRGWKAAKDAASLPPAAESGCEEAEGPAAETEEHKDREA